MKGKKFDAAEKHFQKEREKYLSEIKQLRNVNRVNSDIIKEQNDKILQLEDWVRRLLEYTELSVDDVRETIKREKTITSIFETLRPYFPFY